MDLKRGYNLGFKIIYGSVVRNVTGDRDPILHLNINFKKKQHINQHKLSTRLYKYSTSNLLC